MDAKRQILLVAPTPREASAAGPAAIVAGAGRSAAETVDRLIAERRPDAVVIAGVCGGLDPSLSAGDVVLSRRVVAPDAEERLAPHGLREEARRALRRRGVRFVSSSLLTLAEPVASRSAKRDLWNTYGAAGADMETYGVVEAAEVRDVPWLALRAVLDDASHGLPPSLTEWAGEDEREIARRALRRPGEWASYARLALAYRRALAALRIAVPAVLPALAPAQDIELTPLAERTLAG